jgi:hypothetical protein
MSMAQMMNEINNVHISSEGKPCDSVMLCFENQLTIIADRHMPLKYVRPKKNAEHSKKVPWWSKQIVDEKRVLRKTERLWRHSQLEIHRQAYSMQRNKLKCVVSEAKRRHLAEHLSEHGNDSKKLWQTLNNNLGRQHIAILPDFATLDAMPVLFSEFFGNKVTLLREDLSNQLRQAPACPSIDLAPSIFELSNFEPVNEAEVKQIIKGAPRMEQVFKKAVIIDFLKNRVKLLQMLATSNWRDISQKRSKGWFECHPVSYYRELFGYTG